jgi:hypothetical protein
MAGTVTPHSGWEEGYAPEPVNELLSDKAGSQSPFGDDLTFPLPLAALYYEHPGPETRPNR